MGAKKKPQDDDSGSDSDSDSDSEPPTKKAKAAIVPGNEKIWDILKRGESQITYDPNSKETLIPGNQVVVNMSRRRVIMIVQPEFGKWQANIDAEKGVHKNKEIAQQKKRVAEASRMAAAAEAAA